MGGSAKGEEEEEGGRAFQRPGEREDLPANRVKHSVIRGGARGQRDGDGEGGSACVL